MINHQLIHILKTFDRREMTRFRDFAHSPYHNKHKDVRALVDYLSGCFPVFNERNCNRQLIQEQLFSKNTSTNKLPPVFSYTLRLLERFLVVEQIGEEESEASILLLRRLRERKLNRHYRRTLQQLEQQLIQHTYRDGRFYLHSFQFATESDFYYIELSRQASDDYLQAKQDHLEYFFLCEKLKDACEMQLRQHILQVDYDLGLLPDVLPKLQQQLEDYAKVPPIMMYYQLYQMLSSGEHQYYYAVLPILKAHQRFFPKSELQIIYNYLLNFCIAQINSGYPDFLRASFELYQEQLEQELLSDEEGCLYEWHFKNIVTVGIRLREMEWTKKFIEDSKTNLQPALAENAYTYNLATYYYANQQYEEVLPLLMQVDFNDLRYQLGAKALLMRTYYDLDEFEAFLSLYDAFRQYVKRNKQVTDTQRKGYLNLFRYTKKAFLLKNRKDLTRTEVHQQAVEQLHQVITAEKMIYNQGWLREKVKAL